MARELKAVSFLLSIFLILSLGSVNTEARLMNTLKVDASKVKKEGFVKGLSLGAIKESGPSPGQGNQFTDSRGAQGSIN